MIIKLLVAMHYNQKGSENHLNPNPFVDEGHFVK